jgi:FkbM family methyltransferase
MFAARPVGNVARALLRPANYAAAFEIVRLSPQPLQFARRYLFEGGSYPTTVALRTPLGTVHPTAFTHHDMLTLNEVFCRRDYVLPRGARVVVDVGSNIGLSGLYFLTRAADVRVHLFEPDPRNVECLRQNLAPFAGRWTLSENAVADRNGPVTFGRDTWSVGRYGAIGLDSVDKIEVQCRHINDVLREVLEQDGRVDFLKIDTEGVENVTVAAIDHDLLEGITAVCFETEEPFNPWPERFTLSSSQNVCRLTRRP